VRIGNVIFMAWRQLYGGYNSTPSKCSVSCMHCAAALKLRWRNSSHHLEQSLEEIFFFCAHQNIITRSGILASRCISCHCDMFSPLVCVCGISREAFRRRTTGILRVNNAGTLLCCRLRGQNILKWYRDDRRVTRVYRAITLACYRKAAAPL